MALARRVRSPASLVTTAAWWRTAESDTGDLGLLTYLLESGSDRIGALDFQASATACRARSSDATLDEMVTAADRLEDGLALPPELETALLHGTSAHLCRTRPTVGKADPQPVRSCGRGLRRSSGGPGERAVVLRPARRVRLGRFVIKSQAPAAI